MPDSHVPECDKRKFYGLQKLCRIHGISLLESKEFQMPGPVSDSYDPEWGTSSNAEDIREALIKVYDRISEILGNRKPIYIQDLVAQEDEFAKPTPAILTVWEWRIIRFALERAKDSI